MFNSIFIEFLGYTMSKSKKCNETDIIDDSTASHSLNDVRLTCDDDPRCVFIYLPKCSVSMHENTGGMITCKGRPVHETMVESNGTSCIWEKSKFIVSINLNSINNLLCF